MLKELSKVNPTLHSHPMASLVPISTSTKTSSQREWLLLYGIGTRRVASGKPIIISVTSRKATAQLLLSNHSDGGMLSSSRSCHYCSIEAPTRRCAEPSLCHVWVSSNPYIMISGYWIGPDVEDGWGFIEAYVHRID